MAQPHECRSGNFFLCHSLDDEVEKGIQGEEKSDNGHLMKGSCFESHPGEPQKRNKGLRTVGGSKGNNGNQKRRWDRPTGDLQVRYIFQLEKTDPIEGL